MKTISAMNENWDEIAETLSRYSTTNYKEVDYQHEIEGCLKILGWKTTNGTMRSQETIQIGNANSIRPDIILYREDTQGQQVPVLPIEIKRPNNTHKERQEMQLMSYMRQLRLNTGLYIGENIRLYYDSPNDREKAICILTASINRNDKNGETICNILDYKQFDIRKLDEYCSDLYQKIQARNNLHKRMSEFLSPERAQDNIFMLIREKLREEGFDNAAINDELSEIKLNVITGNTINTLQRQGHKKKGNRVSDQAKGKERKSIKITMENGTVIHENNVMETLRTFIMQVGAENVRTLGIQHSKVPLISNTPDAKYHKSQKPVGGGLLLMTNTNTETKIRDIKQIAESLGLNIKIEAI